jgi:hypothetical protein
MNDPAATKRAAAELDLCRNAVALAETTVDAEHPNGNAEALPDATPETELASAVAHRYLRRALPPPSGITALRERLKAAELSAKLLGGP